VTTPDLRSEVPRSGAQNYARDLTPKVGSGDCRPFTFDCTEARSGNPSGLNRASCRAHKSVKKARLWDGSFQYASQPHSPPMMFTSVSRTERKLPRRSRENCPGVSAETTRKSLLFAHWWYSQSKRTSSLVTAPLRLWNLGLRRLFSKTRDMGTGAGLQSNLANDVQSRVTPSRCQCTLLDSSLMCAEAIFFSRRKGYTQSRNPGCTPSAERDYPT